MPSWNWDESASESGVVHQSTADTDHNDATILQQGYDYSSPLQSANLLGYWPLHEDSGSTANDISGNNNNGTVSGATLGQTGILGTTAYSFDGTDDEVDTGLDSSVEGLYNISITAWVNLNSVSGEDIVCKWGDVFLFNVGDGTNGAPRWAMKDSRGSLTVLDAAATISTNSWVFLAVTYDSPTMRLYINASEDSNSPLSTGGGMNTGTTTARIGNRDANNNSVTDGRIADVRIYDTALTQTQIQTLYDVVNTAGTWTSTTKLL